MAFLPAGYCDDRWWQNGSFELTEAYSSSRRFSLENFDRLHPNLYFGGSFYAHNTFFSVTLGVQVFNAWRGWGKGWISSEWQVSYQLLVPSRHLLELSLATPTTAPPLGHGYQPI
jgi:hypothetical protein